MAGDAKSREAKIRGCVRAGEGGTTVIVPIDASGVRRAQRMLSLGRTTDRRVKLFVAALGLVLSRSLDASAQTVSRVPVILDWEAPADCPDRAHVLGEIERLLGHPPETSVAQPLAAHASVTSTERGSWQLQLETITRDGSETRTMDGPTCLEVADATALILAMAIDPEAIRLPSASSSPMDASLAPSSARAMPSAAPAPLEASPAPDPSRHAAPITTMTAPPRARPWHVTVRTSVGTDIGTFAQAGAATHFALGMLFFRWRVEGSVTYWFPQFTPLALSSMEGGTLSMYEAGLRGCFSLARATIADLEACVRVDFGSMVGTGQGVPFPTTGSALWAGAMAGAGAGLNPVAWLSIRAYLDGGATLLAPTFVVSGLGQVHQPSPGFVRGQLGVEVHF